MHPLEKKTLQLIKQERLLQAGEKVVVGVSAGPDSMALLHVLARLAPALDITLAAVYVNHGLRPDAAPREKNLVEAEANSLGLAFFSGTVDVKGFATQKKLSPEHAARILRYDFFEKTAHRCGAQKIAVAHTADDQAEEILLRLIRGTARKGLSGMQTLHGGKVIRPFLRFPKAHLLDYLDRYSIPHLLDNSNVENFYLRNRIRNDLLPYLEERYNPDIRQTLQRTANILQDEEELLIRITESAFAETVSMLPETEEERMTDSVHPAESYPQALHISLEPFSRQPRAIQRRLLEKCCWCMGCEPSSRQIEALLNLAMENSEGNSLHLADGLRVMIKKETLCFSYPQGHGPFRGNIYQEPGASLPETTIAGPGTYEFPALHKKLVVEDVSDSIPRPGELFPAGEFLDAGLFSFPLTLRSTASGDRFHPLGASGSKKICDFLSDKKIAQDLRPLTPVLCDDNTVVALPGLRIDHRYRITEKTIHAVRIRWEERKREEKT